MSQQTSFESNGWDKKGFIKRLASSYMIKDRATNQLTKLGPAMRARKEQYRIMHELLDSLSRGGPVQELWLKPRRSGWTTMATCVVADLAIFGGFNTGVVAHVEESTQTIYRIGKTFWERLPPGERPELRRETTSIMEFGVKARSERDDDPDGPGTLNTFECRTAGGRHTFAGNSLQAVVGSEVAKWPGDDGKQDDIVTNMLGAMAPDFPGLIIFETTAWGPRGWFFNQFTEGMKYVNRPGFFPWKCQFTAWFQDEGNQRLVPEVVVKAWMERDKAFLEEEDFLRREFKVTREQLWWRRQQIDKLGSRSKFRQDYPATWVEAFSATGNRVFEEAQIRHQQENYIKPPMGRGELITSYKDL